MSARFEELDRADTPLGEISLRRRREPALDVEVVEVKLDEEFLMSSLFTAAEVELARLGLAAVDGDALDVVVGGLGLGYTATAVLDDPRVRSLLVVEVLPQVVDWHVRGLLPESARLLRDPRVRLLCGDFFAGVASGPGLDPDQPGRRFDAVLVDIDHTPAHVLAPGHAGFYLAPGLERLRLLLRPGGAFGLWSDDPPDPDFVALLDTVVDAAEARVVSFPNPITGGRSSNTVYLARHARPAGSPR